MYEERFGTDWGSIESREEVLTRAFALGVSERLGERHPDELDRLVETLDSNYDRSFVEIAYQEGRHEASQQNGDDDEIWAELVSDDETVDLDEPDIDRFEENVELPEAIRSFDADTMPADTTEVLEKPGFLTREGAQEPERRSRSSPKPDEDGERTPFELPEALREDDDEDEPTN